MIHHFIGWLKNERAPEHKNGRWARWLGRGWAQVAYAFKVEPTWLEVNALEIPVANLADDFSGLKLVHMTDFHCGPQVSAAYINEAVDLAHQERPDMIVLTGDFIHAGYKHVEEAANVLGRLHAPLGVWAVLGNHDYSVRHAMGRKKYPELHRAVTQALKKHGIRVLTNESVLLSHGDAHLYVVGLADLWSRAFDPIKALAGLDRNIPRIVLAHNPASIEKLHAQRCDLMLSGHTHGGQVDLPRLGRVALGKNGKRLAAGLYNRGAGYLYVNKGIGVGSFPARFNVRPEVAVLKLVTMNSDE